MPSLEESFLNLVRQVLNDPKLSLEQALANPLAKAFMETVQGSPARAAESKPSEEGPQATPSAAAAIPSSRMFIRAALEDTFDLNELQPEETERTKLLEISDLVMIAGQRRLRLSDTARAAILATARQSEDYRRMLREAVGKDSLDHEAIGKDPIRLPSAWLRCFLSGEFADLETAPLEELKGAQAARERLRLVANLPSDVPPSSDLGRRVGLAELLEPLRVLIGAEGGWDGTPRRDHFVGRVEELAQLRKFVDELSSHSTGEAISRFASRAKSALTGGERPGLMVIEADGGLGKSALMAKFVLDHVHDQSRPFPFVYLDFDRATLDPERPNQILLEIARQLQLQYPQAATAFAELVSDIRIELSASTTEGPSAQATIRDPYAKFVETVKDHATRGEQAFLLVLDTLEVVQWNPTAVEHLAKLIEQFREKGLDELKVVACGRADIPELRQARGVGVPAIHLKLKPLLTKEAREMAEILGRRGIGKDWQSGWSDAIARGKPKRSRFVEALPDWIASSEKIRREPLSVRVAVDFVVRTDPSRRQEVIDDIADASESGGDDFVARLYEKRILNHVRNSKAGELAWPGLVIRLLTAEIVRDVLAEICGMLPDEAEAAFKALGQEIWMVTREGDALRHRPDLRARTLPLMKRKDPSSFDRVAHAAVAYFGKHRERSKEDRVEWIYHRFLVGEDPQLIDPDVTSEVLPLLVRAEADFSPESPAASYLVSRTARRRLAPTRLRKLRPTDALLHLKTVASNVFELDDASLDRAASTLSERLGEGPPGNLIPWTRALWIKSGAWHRLRQWPVFHKEEVSGNLLLRSELFWTARIVPSLDPHERLKRLEECMRAISIQGEHHGFRTMVHAMVLARLANELPTYHDLDARISDLFGSMKSNPAPSTQAALRIAVIFGETCRNRALSLWLYGRRRGSSERVRNPTVSLAELYALSRVLPETRELFSEIPDKDLALPMRFTDEMKLSSFSRALEEMAGSAANGNTGVGTGLAAIFAHRQEDWIVPFGYAAHLAAGGEIPRKAAQRLAGYFPSRERSDIVPAAEKPGDMLAAMRMADEAGDLAEFARLILANSDSTPASAGLRLLVQHHARWTVALGQLVSSASSVTPRVTPAASEDEPPAPGSIIHEDDPQKERWGGLAERDGRLLHATLESVERDIFYFSLVVESIDGTDLESPVIFHLHESFPRSKVTIRRIEGNRAVLSEWSAYGVFSVGAQVRNAKKHWIALELNLATLPDLPKRFLKR